MAGGTFDKTVGKTRPGTYINFEDTSQTLLSGGSRGVVILPLTGTDYGPAKQFITLTSAAIDAARAMLGYSVYEDDAAGNMLLIREAFKNASSVILYICTEGTTAASGTGGGLTGTAKYKGTRGNSLTFAVLANPVAGFDVEIYLAGSLVEEFEGITAVSDLADSSWITFALAGESEISEVAGVNLTGGADATTENADVTAFLDASDTVTWNTMAFPMEDATLQAALKTKIKYLRDSVGKGVQAAAPNFAGDYEGIINVTNGYWLDDVEVTADKAVAFVAGITAGANNVTSNTYKQVDSATAVSGAKTNEEAIASLKAGEFFFSMSSSGTVIIEQDINSFVTYTSKKGKSYSKNRVIRVYDTFAESIQLNFPPNMYDNDSDGWDIMEGVGKAILKQYGPKSDGGVGAIKNIDYDNDFLVDRETSSGDQTYFNVGLEAVDSAEKLYFTIATR